MRRSETITTEAFRQRLVELCLKSGMAGFPRRPRDRHILLKSVALTLEVRATYTEKQVDRKLVSWLGDIVRSIGIDRVTLRRLLVDEGYLGRERDGSRYWVAALGPRRGEFETRFDAQIDELDVSETVAEGARQLQMSKRAHASGGKIRPHV